MKHLTPREMEQIDLQWHMTHPEPSLLQVEYLPIQAFRLSMMWRVSWSPNSSFASGPAEVDGGRRGKVPGPCDAHGWNGADATHIVCILKSESFCPYDHVNHAVHTSTQG